MRRARWSYIPSPWFILAISVVIALYILFHLSYADAADYYVVDGQGETCDDTHPGTQAQPWCNPPGGVGWSGATLPVAGDTVYFETGGVWSYTDARWGRWFKPIGGVHYTGKDWPSQLATCAVPNPLYTPGSVLDKWNSTGCAKVDLHHSATITGINFMSGSDHPTFETIVEGFEFDGNMTSCINAFAVNGRDKSVEHTDLHGAPKIMRFNYVHDIQTEGYSPCHNKQSASIYSYGFNITTGSYVGWGVSSSNIEVAHNVLYKVMRNGIVCYPANGAGHENTSLTNVSFVGNTLVDIGQGSNYNAPSAFNAKNQCENLTVAWNYVENVKQNGFGWNDSNAGYGGYAGHLIAWNIVNGAGNHCFLLGGPNEKSLAIHSNIFYGCTREAVSFHQNMSGPLDVAIYNNTFPHERMHFKQSGADRAGRVFWVANNLVGSIQDDTGDAELHTNHHGVDCLKNMSEPPTGFVGAIGTDKEPTPDGYTITQGSACEQAGTEPPAWPARIQNVELADTSINSRMRVTPWDIAAYALVGGTTPPPLPPTIYPPSNLRTIGVVQ